jgi:hypothetical protein
MAKWADYTISGIWKTTQNNSERITHVMLHEDKDTYIGSGVKRTEAYVISLLKPPFPKTVKTMRWSYETSKWIEGALVTIEKVNGVELLRTVPNATVKDNLDNSLPMDQFSS